MAIIIDKRIQKRIRQALTDQVRVDGSLTNSTPRQNASSDRRALFSCNMPETTTMEVRFSYHNNSNQQGHSLPLKPH